MFMSGDGLRVVAQDGIRALLYFVVAMCVIFFLGLVAYIIAMRAIRVFVTEVERLRENREPLQPALPQPAGGGDELPELMPGGMPSLDAEAVEGDMSQQPIAALGRRFDFLNNQPLDDLADSLGKEKADDLALLFGSLTDSNETLATRLFAALPAALQNEVSQHLSQLTNYDPEKLSQLESRMRSLVEYGVRGSDRLGRLLSRIPAQQREGILGEMMTRDPAAVEKVESSMIPFESLSEVPAAELRRLLTSVPYQEWGTALRGAPEDMVKHILEQFPAEAQAALRDYLEQPQPMDKVLEARSKILSQAYDLASKGQLTINKRGSSSSSQLI
jgi:flagellar motor switch protein FliG